MAEGRIVGIDYGLARLGIAISDPSKLIASPLMTLQAEKKIEKTAQKLVKAIEEYCIKQRTAIEEIVIGLPLMMSGKKGFLADEVEYFVRLLSTLTSVPIEVWDERLTSVQADRSLREGSLTRKKRSQLVDTVAAVIILQSFLDARRFKLSQKDGE